MDSIIRIRRATNCVVFSAQILNNKKISYRAKGIFAHLMSLEDGVKISVSEVMGSGPEGRDSIRSSFSELEQFGYVKRVAIKTEDGKLCGSEVIVYEESELSEKDSSAPSVKKKRARSETGTMKRPTAEDVKEYAESIGANIEAGEFIDYYDVLGWRYGKNMVPMRDWKAAVRQWKRRRNKKEEKKNLLVV